MVDDDEDSLFVTSLLLSEAGYLVDDAADGEEAWEALLSTRYDLLLTDHNMPRLCGLDLIARVRAAGMKIPVVLYSGSPGLGEGPDYSHLALTAVLQKSTNFAEIQHAVQRILSPSYKDGLSSFGVRKPPADFRSDWVFESDVRAPHSTSLALLRETTCRRSPERGQ